MDQSDATLPTLLDQVSEETDITYGDLALLGASLLSTISSVALHGWASPASSLDYTRSATDVHSMVVRDFVAWTSYRKNLAEGCEERLRAFVEECGWTLHLVTQTSKGLFPNQPPATDAGT